MRRVLRPQPMRRRPTASVVVPCYNYGHHLAQLVETVTDQPGVDVDVLVVDDCSPDGSGEVAARLAADRDDVRVLRHQVNRGHIRTYNDGLAEVRGDYVVLLSADDLLPVGAISRAVALMEANPSVGLTYGYARSFSGEPPAVEDRVRNWSVWPGHDWLSMSARKGRCFIASPEVVMRRTALEQVGDYDPRLPHSGDFDLWMRTALRWDIGRVNGPVQALYRVHENNMHLTTYAGWLTDLVERRRTFGLLFDEHAPDRPDVQQLRPAAMRALAVESVRRALAARRDEGDSEAKVQAHLDFAVETWPGVRSTAWYRLASAGADRSGPAVPVRRFGSKVRHHLEWRYERRYGT